MPPKAALKAAKAALDAQDYEAAIKEALQALTEDKENYFARLFLARAYEKKGNLDDAAKTYREAAKSKPEDSQAWLGLCSVYEAQGSERVDEYRDAACRVAEIFTAADDQHRCQTAVDKLIAFSKQHGSKTQYKKALEFLLPSGPIYETLEGRIPHASNTYLRIAEITEEEEAQAIKQEIAARRTRIGARLGQVTTDVKREIYAKSTLETLYQAVIDWSVDDEVRRQYEEKLLERAHDALLVLPLEQKPAKLDQVLNLAEGMVIIHHAYQLAWDLVIETRDVDDLKELDANLLREYAALFPEVGLGKIMRAWLGSELSPFPVPNEDSAADEKTHTQVVSAEDRLLMMTEGISDAEHSPFAYRLVADYFLYLEEHEVGASTARTGLKTTTSKSNEFGMSMQNTRDALNSVLGTALVHHQAPRNHAEARRLFEDILERKPRWTPALVGLGLILEEKEDYDHAIDSLSKALTEDPGNVRVGTELAWCRALSGDYSRAQHDLENYLPEMKADDPQARDLRAQVLYRVGLCAWELDPSKAARRDRNGPYRHFLAAIKTNVNFAPAYTSLGIYYSDYAKDKKRARQCFQKAFELSPSETNAAERLARYFADRGDWDIVEVIAQRVIDTGRARPPPGSKRKGLSWPYSALGVVQMNKQEYQMAITSFLAALRISPDDYQSYVGLAESYHNSGRYNSALRTFSYAIDPQDGVEMRVSEEKWFARYMLANVYRELGEYDEAVKGLQDVLEGRPSEFGVLMSLLQTFVDRSWRCLETGLYGQAVDSACQAITTATTISKSRPNAFNLWRAIGDASQIFSYVQSASAVVPINELKELLTMTGDTDTYAALGDVDLLSVEALTSSGGDANSTTRLLPVFASTLAYKRALHSSGHDIHAQAVAWYNLGWAESRAHACVEMKAGKKYLRAAVRSFKRAIELEAGNAEFWNALGVVTTTLNPKVAQHAFVRSLHLNELNAKVWTNLGVLYLVQNDHELAHRAFGRAQSTDPEYAHAWLGEGLIALSIGDAREAVNHFTHAFEISDSSSPVAKRLYGQSVFDQLLATPSASNDLTALIQPIFALEQLRRQTSQDLPFQHLMALYFELVGNHVAAAEVLATLCAAAEADFEASESLTALARFAQSKCDIARNHLAVLDFDNAAACAETALDLSSDADSSGLEVEARRKLRLSAHLTAGLAYHNVQNNTEAIAMFRSALQDSGNDPEVVASLVQVLWAHGGVDEKSVAREQLFECIERHPEHVGSVVLLAAVAALDDDTDTVAAVQDDLRSLRTKADLTPSQACDIQSLISAFASLTNASDSSREQLILAEAQTATALQPNQPQTWSELAQISGEAHPAEMALQAAVKAVPPNGALEAEDLAEAYASVGTVGDAMQSIVLAPWRRDGWDTLAEAVSPR